ncbi:hypothetical protein CR513_41443, partial [Mucuna pruriens]
MPENCNVNTARRGVYRLKHHLAGTQKDVRACKGVTDKVKKEIWEIIVEEESIEVCDKRKSNEAVDNFRNIFKKIVVSLQATINTMFKKCARETACQAIDRFFYNNAIPVNVARSEEFGVMFDLISRHGIGFKPSSFHGIRVKYLKEEVIHQMLWKHIELNGRKKVNSPRGTIFLKSIDASTILKIVKKIFEIMNCIVEEIEEDNVVQVVTDNATNYKDAGQMLMTKRKGLFWTPYATYYTKKKIPIHEETITKGRIITTYIYSRTSLISVLQYFTKGRDLVRIDITHFSTSYLTLGCLHENKGTLIRMFTSNEWKSSRFAKTKDGKLIEDVILDKEFWKNIIICLKGACPLIEIKKLVMRFIYEAMDQTKEKIQNAFNDVKKRYLTIYMSIRVLDKQLHRPLHVVGYFLNPQLHYHLGFKANLEAK